MKNHNAETTVYDQTLKPRKPKSREVSSRFLSPSSNSSADQCTGQSPKSNFFSPVRQKQKSSTDARKQKSLENSGFLRKLWPSSNPVSSKSSNTKVETLADCLGNDRLGDLTESKANEKTEYPIFLIKQRSCTEFNRFENDRKISKENHNPVFGGSMRYTGKSKFQGKSAYSSSNASKASTFVQDESDHFVPGRFSVDDNALRKKPFGKGSDSLSDNRDSESEYSDLFSATSGGTPKSFQASYMAPTLSSRKHGIEIQSKYMNDSSSRSRRWSGDSNSNSQRPTSSENSPKTFTLKNALRKANSFGVPSKWALSPGRSSSPPVLPENKVKILSSTKPPTSPSRSKGVGSFLSMGVELLKGKKSSENASSPLGSGVAESFHQLRLLHSKMIQWRHANTRAESVNESIRKQAENKFISAYDTLAKLQESVVRKRLQLEKEKLEMKLNYILKFQIKQLETWENMEREHVSAVSTTKDYMHSAVCNVPLIEGAKVEMQSASVAFRQASDLAASINSMLSCSSTVEETAEVLAELAVVLTQEKLLLEECLELFRIISTLQIQERSLKCSIMQFKLREKKPATEAGDVDMNPPKSTEYLSMSNKGRIS